jgi:4-hydroxyproline epimerase
VTVEVPGHGAVTGDIAWGGNWFFLVADHRETIDLGNIERLTDVTWKIRRALEDNGITGASGGLIDHIELFGAPLDAANHSRNFVLCPGKAYDRSPCGTGTSAKLACLAADGKLDEGQPWVQESIIGSLFTGRYRWLDQTTGTIEPTIIGTAFVNAEARLLLNEKDPFCWGIQ